MAVSNPAQLTSVKTVFGGPGALSVYIAGGSYVPAGTSGDNGAVPSSLPLPLSKLAGTVAFTPGTVTYTSSSGTFTVPIGTTTIAIEIVGGAGAGGYGARDFVGDQDYGGGGGGGGAYSKTSASASGGGQSLSWAVGRGGNYTDGINGVNTTVSGSLISAMTAGGGQAGGSAQGGFSGSGGIGGPGGTASGGNVANNTGSAGSDGGAFIPGYGGDSYSTGGNGGVGSGDPGASGAGGNVTFTWS